MLHKIKDIKICVSFCAQYILLCCFVFGCIFCFFPSLLCNRLNWAIHGNRKEALWDDPSMGSGRWRGGGVRNSVTCSAGRCANVIQAELCVAAGRG